MEPITSKISNFFGTITGKASELYNRAKSNIMSLGSNQPEPSLTTPTTTSTGGAKKRRSKKTKRVRFSKKRKVYRYKTMRRK